MYADVRVKIPDEKGKITRKTIKGTTYIYYQLDRKYISEKKYSIPKSTPIGKGCEDDRSMMIPNERYLIYFPEAELPYEKKTAYRSACLRVVCVKLLMMKPNKKTQITIYILSFLQQFLNTNFNNLYKSQRNNVRKHYNIPATETLWFNGFDYKTIIFINNNRCFEVYRVPIQRMIWTKSSGERVHIYLRPSFVIKHCPFSLCTLEFIRNAGIPCETELFEMIKDPENLLDELNTVSQGKRRTNQVSHHGRDISSPTCQKGRNTETGRGSEVIGYTRRPGSNGTTSHCAGSISDLREGILGPRNRNSREED